MKGFRQNDRNFYNYRLWILYGKLKEEIWNENYHQIHIQSSGRQSIGP